MKPLFQSIKIKKPGRNVFDLSHEKKLSMNMGDLIPIFLEEVVPGDKFRMTTEILMRLAPLIAPLMHRVNVFTHFFFVPYRLLYDNWESFITGGVTGTENPAFPKLIIRDSIKGWYTKGSLADYLGVPTVAAGETVTNEVNISALPFRAYQLIYNEYYRDQTLTPKVPITKNGTVQFAEESEIMLLRKRCWEKDYFTSALPWAQRGGEVLIPTESEITYKYPATVFDSGGQPVAGDISADLEGRVETQGTDSGIDNIDNIQENITVNELRRAVKLQEWLEKNARAGSRYVEQIFSHFGVKSSDARLQRPEYLGGGKSPVVISETLSTVSTAEHPQGNMAGHGISVGTTHQFKKYFEEHGFIMGIMSVLPRTAYMQGLPKIFTKFDKFDYYWPTFAKLGEQEVLEKELYCAYSGANTQESLFGYQSRYSEYKFCQSTIHGDMRDTLDFYHMGRKFANRPQLNAAFVTSDPRHDIFAVEDPAVHKLYVQLYNNVKAIRPMPIFGEPSL